MRKLLLVGVLSAFSILGTVSILSSARAAGDGLPVGTIVAWGGQAKSLPAGWMLCNGALLGKSAYAELFAALGTSWGSSGDRFNLPDLRGRFLRGDDGGTGRDPDAKRRVASAPGGSATGAGSVQEDSTQNHTHDQTPHSHQYLDQAAYVSLTSGSDYICPTSLKSGVDSSADRAIISGAAKYGTRSRLKAGEESRPKNASVNFIIKVK